jgi:hypothetical protein
MTCRLNSPVIRAMSYSGGYLTLMFPKYDRVYQCDTKTAYELAYSTEPTKFFNQNIKGKLRIIQ